MCRHFISDVRCACFAKKDSKTKFSILCCLRGLENSTNWKEAILIQSALYWLMGLLNKDKSPVSGVPPSYTSCALCVFCKKAQQNQNLDSVLFAFFRKQHEFKRSHFDIECPLLANGSYKIKIRVLWIVFRHLISVVRCACFEKKHSKTKISLLCCLRFLENSTSLKEAILI